MDLELAGRVVLVTGAGQGLGREIGLAFAREGAHVAFHYHSSGSGAEDAAAEAGKLTGAAMAVQADIRSDGDVAAAVEAVESQLGPIEILVNNAAATGAKPFLDTTPDDWSFQVDVTVTGTLRITQAVARRMVDRSLAGGHPPSPGSGAIVSLMGDSGRVGESGLTVTATTRATTMALTKSLAKELARHGIRANCVSIGLVQTDRFDAHAGAPDEQRMKKILAQYPLRRLGRASDVAPLVLLLASPLSGWTTGQVISVNGGYAMP
ncbi:MAG TPA: SDR family oxidoreductase [Acidimicrobiia bacterium]|nr:SDR family oxidoreductase [Acidimicrobiia bacterium]